MKENIVDNIQQKETNKSEGSLAGDLRQTISDLAQKEREKVNKELEDKDKELEASVAESLSIEFGLLLQNSGIDLEEFNQMPIEEQYSMVEDLQKKKDDGEREGLRSHSGNIEKYSHESVNSFLSYVKDKAKA
jgi:hypothetical protein